MPTLKTWPTLLTSALLLTIAPCSLAAPAPYSGMQVFGDSLSDAGQFPDMQLPGESLRFTNRDGVGQPYALNASTRLGQRLGIEAGQLAASTSVVNATLGLADGNNWATGGYTTPQILDSITATSSVASGGLVLRQRDGYLPWLAAQGLRVDPNTLFYLNGGANDFFQQSAIDPSAIDAAFSITSANTLADSAAALDQAGARYMMVWLLPDLGRTPGSALAGDPATSAGLSALSSLFNQTLVTRLAALDSNVIGLNIPLLFDEVVADPARYGLAAGQDLTGTCYDSSAGDCLENPVYGLNGSTPDASQLLFNDFGHPTTTGQQLIADYAYSLLAAPWEISLLPETAQASLRAHQSWLRNQWQADEGAWQAPGHWRVSVGGGATALDLDGQRSAASGDGRGHSLDMAASYRLRDDWRLGLSLGVARQTLEAGAQASDYRLDSQLLGAFAQYRHHAWWADTSLTGGRLDYGDLERRFALNSDTRTEKGNTDGDLWAVSGRFGYQLFADAPWQLSPFLSADYAKVQVDGYGEDGLRSSALTYADQEVTSKRLGAGLRGALQLAPATRLYAEVAYQHEYEDATRELQMHLRSLPSLDYRLRGYTPASDQHTATLGLSHRFSEGLALRADYNYRQADDDSQQGLSLALSLDY
ncbi:outer membrane lipase/esterase [Pseudomonas cuatrocienegasensis]|uniref:Outer membrane lipase/esterase n=1 Tax=Pseudomonas cuatrocienegasensis TaxID=543360 RepID=A0ABY1BJV2_9PSED|nr:MULTISPECIES: autotransporter domain-containing SGNH/GDSL hydrolase family protein [Pseudomonas]OEC32625.1 autotransporter outer membrane beta-barrel domain-containing protein [Pseudomonas sp. 21C1]SER02316.1 outer membrane lipase/esterase [Pseudomonas cuatrocienegasensis]